MSLRLLFYFLIPFALLAQDAASDALDRARVLAGSLARMEDSRLAVKGIAGVGRAVCRRDYETARAIFETGAERQRRAHAGGSLAAWEELLQSARACREALADSLASSVPIRRPSLATLSSDIRTALEQAGEEDSQSAGRLEPATPYFRELAPASREDFVRALLKLRQHREERASEIFLETLRYLSLDPARSIGSLFVLGNYIYGPSTSGDTLMPVEAGGGLVYVLTVRRADSPMDAEWSYLSSVGRVLSTDRLDIRHFILARQLLPRAREFSAEFAKPFTEAARGYGSDFEEIGLQFRPLAADPSSPFASRLEEFQAHWAAGRFEQARRAAAQVSISRAKDQLSSLAAFGEVGERLRRGDLDQALALTRDVQPGAKQALASLGVAAAALAAKDEWRALEMLKLAAQQFGSLGAGERAPLWTIHAGLQAKISLEAAFTSLGQAVEAWNDRDARESSQRGIRWSVAGLLERVESGGVRRDFRLDLPGLPAPAFAPTLAAFTADLDRADAIIAGLRNPERHLEAQLAAIEIRLAQAPGVTRGEKSR